jgi:hypothetical protein
MNWTDVSGIRSCRGCRGGVTNAAVIRRVQIGLVGDAGWFRHMVVVRTPNGNDCGKDLLRQHHERYRHGGLQEHQHATKGGGGPGK